MEKYPTIKSEEDMRTNGVMPGDRVRIQTSPGHFFNAIYEELSFEGPFDYSGHRIFSTLADSERIAVTQTAGDIA